MNAHKVLQICILQCMIVHVTGSHADVCRPSLLDHSMHRKTLPQKCQMLPHCWSHEGLWDFLHSYRRRSVQAKKWSLVRINIQRIQGCRNVDPPVPPSEATWSTWGATQSSKSPSPWGPATYQSRADLQRRDFLQVWQTRPAASTWRLNWSWLCTWHISWTLIDSSTTQNINISHFCIFSHQIKIHPMFTSSTPARRSSAQALHHHPEVTTWNCWSIL